MKMTEARQLHSLKLTPHEHAPLVAFHIKIHIVIVAVVDILTTAFKITSFEFSVGDGLFLLLLEGADTVPPVVLSVLELELFHERPVVVPVAFGELLEVAGPSSEELVSREVGGAREGHVHVFLGSGCRGCGGGGGAPGDGSCISSGVRELVVGVRGGLRVQWVSRGLGLGRRRVLEPVSGSHSRERERESTWAGDGKLCYSQLILRSFPRTVTTSPCMVLVHCYISANRVLGTQFFF